MIKLVYAFLADSAQLNDGKFSVFGGDYDTINVEKFPAIAPVASLICKVIGGDKSDDGTKAIIAIQVLDPDGEQANPLMTQEVELKRNPTPYPSSSITLFEFPIFLKSPGEYRLRISVNENEVLSKPLFVKIKD